VTIDLRSIKIFADGADRDGILELRSNPSIRGFTTNPTLMRAAGVDDYERFALGLVQEIPDLPISFEVVADDFEEMERQALKIAGWGSNVYVKIPITDTRGQSSIDLARRLVLGGIKINVTALLTIQQVEITAEAVAGGPPALVSVFAGRVADTGRDPVPLMISALDILAAAAPDAELVWASPREVLNIVQAAEIGCHVITVTHDLLKKLPLLGKDLDEYSLETVTMFHRDAQAAQLSI
jgi:transaldolase